MSFLHFIQRCSRLFLLFFLYLQFFYQPLQIRYTSFNLIIYLFNLELEGVYLSVVADLYFLYRNWWHFTIKWLNFRIKHYRSYLLTLWKTTNRKWSLHIHLLLPITYLYISVLTCILCLLKALHSIWMVIIKNKIRFICDLVAKSLGFLCAIQ